MMKFIRDPFLLAASLYAVASAQDDDPCSPFSLDCDECVTRGTEEANCFYCPADGQCRLNVESGFPFRCVNPGEFVETFGSCAPDDIYRPRFDGNTESDTPYYSDPLYSAQGWVFKMINVLPVWRLGLTGAGIRVRVNDDGLNFEHEEFAGRFDMEGSCDGFFGVPEASDPEVPNNHGTQVASILGAEANNGHCSVGVAPGVTFSACYATGDASQEGIGFLAEKIDSMDISQNSWGGEPCFDPQLQGGERRSMQEIEKCPFEFKLEDPELAFPCDVCDFDVPTVFDLSEECQFSIQKHCSALRSIDQQACRDFIDIYADGNLVCQYTYDIPEVDAILERLANEGRDGKGIIIVFASGNEALEGVDINHDIFAKSRFSIGVAAVGQDGRVAGYSNAGAAVMVAAPGGNNADLNENEMVGAGITSSTSCGQIPAGTSFAAPVVSGVIALMLEANPDLSWRDVQGILATTSRVPGFLSKFEKDQGASAPSESSVGEFAGTMTNPAGFTHSYDIGFGIVDALAAVTLAKEWVAYGKELTIGSVSEEINAMIPDSRSDPLELTIEVSEIDTGVNDFSIENVNVLVALDHTSRGDLQVEITSPSGTVSVLAPGNRNEVQVGGTWTLVTVRSWGESPVGTWTLTITDVSPGTVDGTPPSTEIIEWGLQIFGRDVSQTDLPPDVMAPASAPVVVNAPVMPVSAPISGAFGAFRFPFPLMWTSVTFALAQFVWA